MKRMLLKSSLVILLPVFIMFSGCSKDCCTNIDTEVTIFYKTDTGENLINNSNDFREEYIRIYYKNGEEFQLAGSPNSDYQNNHYVHESGGKLLLTVYPSDIYEGNFSTTLIELNGNVTDTLLCQFRIKETSVVCTQAWLNGAPMQNTYMEVVR